MPADARARHLTDSASMVGRWPSVVRDIVEPRAAEVRERAHGRVLDLDDVDPEQASRVSGPFDTVISVGALTRWADLPAAVAFVEQVLHPEGELLFIEPVGRPGWRGLVSATAGASLPAVRGAQLGRDVPAAIRTRLLVNRVSRFEVATPVWPLRHFVDGSAIHWPASPIAPTNDQPSNEDET